MFRCESDDTDAQKSAARFGHRVPTSIHQVRTEKDFEAGLEPKRGVVVRHLTMHCLVGPPAFPNLSEVERVFFPDPQCRSRDAIRHRPPKDFLTTDCLLWCHRKGWHPA